jgi:hypothetical protein
MKVQTKQLLTGISFALSALAFGGPVFADVVTRMSADNLSQSGRGSFLKDDGIAKGVRALQSNVADVGRSSHSPLTQSPGTLVGAANAPAVFVNGGAAGLDSKFGRR